MEKIIELTKNLLENKGTLIYLSEYGSVLYGTNNPDSDIDYRGIFLPDKNNQLLGIKCEEINYTTGNSASKNGKEDIDIKLMSLQKFIKLCSQGDTNALDLLFSIPCSHINHYGVENVQEIFDNIAQLINVKNMKAFVGYAIAQARKYGIKGSRLGLIKDIKSYIETLPAVYDELPLSTRVGTILHCYEDPSYCFHKALLDKSTNIELDYLCVCGSLHQYNISIKEFKNRINQIYDKYGERAKLAESNQGIDWKALSHAVRCIDQCKELLLEGTITFPLKNKEFIKDIKYGKINYKEVEEIIIKGLEEVQKLQSNTEINYKYRDKLWTQFILNSYSNIY